MQAFEVVSIHIPWLAEAVCVAPVTTVDCQSMLAKPVAVPLLAKVEPAGIVIVDPAPPKVAFAPAGIVIVSPDVPKVKVVPDCGST